jgi:hypothetical protein
MKNEKRKTVILFIVLALISELVVEIGRDKPFGLTDRQPLIGKYYEEMLNKEKNENNDMKYKGENYLFYRVDASKLPRGTSKIMSIYEARYDERYGCMIVCDSSYHSLFIGQLITLFGESDNNNIDSLVSYVVAAEKEDGSIIYLEVYYGDSGPAVGGLHEEEYILAAKELEQLIMSAKASDFEIKSVYEDLGITFKMGVKDGIAYYE